MPIDNYDNLSEMQLDVLKEIGNIGAGNAATALSTMLSERVNMSVPVLKVLNFSEIANILGGPETEIVGIVLNMSNDVEGMLMFLLEKQFAHMVLNILLQKRLDGFDTMSEMDLSALKEIGNILSGSYLNALSKMTGLNISLSPPEIAVDMAGAILSYPAMQFGLVGDKLLLIEEEFMSGRESVKSHLLIIPRLESLDIIMKRLGVE